jgi:hypothetical protein
MATVNGSDVHVGDWLRALDSGREGRVTDVDGDRIHLAMSDGSQRIAAPADVRWNWWDGRSGAP